MTEAGIVYVDRARTPYRRMKMSHMVSAGNDRGTHPRHGQDRRVPA